MTNAAAIIGTLATAAEPSAEKNTSLPAQPLDDLTFVQN
jgi:hypothetical protein